MAQAFGKHCRKPGSPGTAQKHLRNNFDAESYIGYSEKNNDFLQIDFLAWLESLVCALPGGEYLTF
jgi:hypothetical protein